MTIHGAEFLVQTVRLRFFNLTKIHTNRDSGPNKWISQNLVTNRLTQEMSWMRRSGFCPILVK